MAKMRKRDEPELKTGAWARFERAIDVVMKSPPQHWTKKSKPHKKKSRKYFLPRRPPLWDLLIAN